MRRLIFLFILTLLIACDGSTLPPETSSERPINVKVGETIQIRLNYINTQPYIWRPVEPIAQGLESRGVSNILPPMAEGEDGVTYAQQDWAFVAVASGEYELSFEYASAFDPNEPATDARTYTIIAGE